MVIKRLVVRTLCILLVLLFGCAAPQIQTTTKSGGKADLETGVAQCKIPKDVQRPMLVEWPAVEKTALQSSAKREIVVVRYDGCRLKRISGCRVTGDYEFTQTSRSKDGFVIRDKAELFAKLPLGAVSLEGEVGRGRQLALSYVAVGTRTAQINAVTEDMLEGGCEGATHFVSSMVVGAYELASQTTGQGGVGVKAGAAGAGGTISSEAQIIRADGDLRACSNRQTPADDVDCQAVVQLVLEPIQPPSGIPDVVAAVAATDPEPPVEDVPADAGIVPDATEETAAEEAPPADEPTEEERVVAATEEPAPEEPSVEEPPANNEEPVTEPPAEPVAAEERDGLSPVPFWVMGGVTAALGIGTIVIDAVVQNKYEKAENNPLDNSLQNDVTRLQAVEWALLGTTAASLITTVVLALFTDFKGEGEGDQTGRHMLKPIVLENGGMLILEGRF